MITIFWLSLVSIVSFVIVREYLDTTKPVISVNRVRLEKPSRLDRNGTYSTVYMFIDNTKSLSAEESKRYVTLDSRYLRTTKVGDQEITQVETNWVGKCTESTNQDSKNDFFNDLEKLSVNSKINYTELFAENILCVNFEKDQTIFEGSRSHLPFHRPLMEIYPCSLPDPTQCASPQELSVFHIIIVSSIYIARYKEKKNPLQVTIDVDTSLFVDIASKTKITTFVKMNQIYDDDIGIIDERHTHSFLDTDRVKAVTGTRLSQSIYCSKQQITAGLCEPYMTFEWRSSFDRMVIQRRYKQFFGVISEIGGFNDLIIYCLLAGYMLYNSYSYKRLIRHQLMEDLREWRGESGKGSGGHRGGELELNGGGNPQRAQELIRVNKRGVNPLLDFEVMKRTNSQAKVILGMFFGLNSELERLIPQIILHRRLRDKSQKGFKNNNRGAQGSSNELKIDHESAINKNFTVSNLEEAAPKSGQIQPKKFKNDENSLSQPTPTPEEQKGLQLGLEWSESSQEPSIMSKTPEIEKEQEKGNQNSKSNRNLHMMKKDKIRVKIPFNPHPPKSSFVKKRLDFKGKQKNSSPLNTNHKASFGKRKAKKVLKSVARRD